MHVCTQGSISTSPIGKGVKESIKKFAKGSSAQAEVGVVVQEELSKTKAAELARANRQQD